MSLRTLIEILLPYQIAPGVSDTLMWFAPFLVAVLALVAMRDFIRHNLVITIMIGVVVYFACIYSNANTKYKNSWDNLYLGDPIWGSLIQLGAENTNQAEAGRISWEECYYRRNKIQEGVDLVVEAAMPATVFNNECDHMRAIWRNRDDRQRTLRAGLEGGTISHWSYRIAIDRMNLEAGPFENYRRNRDQEQQEWRNVILVPFLCLLAVVAVISFFKRPMAWGHAFWTKLNGTRRFARHLAGFTHARSLEKVGFVRGRLRLAFPVLYVGEVPHDLSRAWIDPEEPRVLHIDSTGSRLFLYADQASAEEERRHVDPAPVRPKFFFHEGPNPSSPEVKLKRTKASIFDR